MKKRKNNLKSVDKKAIWRPFTIYDSSIRPIHIERAKNEILFDNKGKEYLDLISSWWVNIHGHVNLSITKAIKKQLDQFDQILFTDFSHKPASDLAKKIIQVMPRDLSRIFFSDNGSTAVEVSLKIAWQYWVNLGKKRKYFLTFTGGYHGDTFGSMSVSHSSGFFDSFKDLLFQVKEVPFPHTWDGDSLVNKKEKESFKRLEHILSNNSSNIAAFICEPIVQGSSGMRVCRPSFMKKIVQRLKKENIPVIFDEVMTGFGRTGQMFAYQKIGISPDIICLSKGLTGGALPLGLTICSNRISKVFQSDDPKKMLPHGHSYTANPISCSAAVASLDLFKSKQIFQKIKMIENIHRKRINDLSNLECVERTRVIGLIAAFEIKGVSKNYGSEFARNLKYKFLRRGLIIRPLGNVVYLMPPYCIKPKNLHRSYDIIIALLSNC